MVSTFNEHLCRPISTVAVTPTPSILAVRNNKIAADSSSPNNNNNAIIINGTQPPTSALKTAASSSTAIVSSTMNLGLRPGKLTIKMQAIPAKLYNVSRYMQYSGICLLFTILASAAGAVGAFYWGPQYYTIVMIGMYILLFANKNLFYCPPICLF